MELERKRKKRRRITGGAAAPWNLPGRVASGVPLAATGRSHWLEAHMEMVLPEAAALVTRRMTRDGENEPSTC